MFSEKVNTLKSALKISLHKEKSVFQKSRQNSLILNSDIENSKEIPLTLKQIQIPFKAMSEMERRIHIARERVTHNYIMRERDSILKLFKIGLLNKLKKEGDLYVEMLSRNYILMQKGQITTDHKGGKLNIKKPSLQHPSQTLIIPTTRILDTK